MTLGNLTVETQVGVSTGWVEADKDRSCFEGEPALAALLPEIDAAHGDLIVIQIKSSANSEEIKRLTDLVQRLDARHDNKGKGVHGMFGAVALLAESAEEADHYLETRDMLMPNGLRFVQRSYLDEAGGVALAEGRITDSVRRTLRSIPTPHGNLMDEVNEWIRAGRDLGDAERRRVQLAETRDEETVSGKEVNAARRRWNDVAEAVVKIVDLLNHLDEETRNRILQPLKTAEEKCDRAAAEARARNRNDETEPSSETEDTDTDASSEEAV